MMQLWSLMSPPVMSGSNVTHDFSSHNVSILWFNVPLQHLPTVSLPKAWCLMIQGISPHNISPPLRHEISSWHKAMSIFATLASHRWHEAMSIFATLASHSMTLCLSLQGPLWGMMYHDALSPPQHCLPATSHQAMLLFYDVPPLCHWWLPLWNPSMTARSPPLRHEASWCEASPPRHLPPRHDISCQCLSPKQCHLTAWHYVSHCNTSPCEAHIIVIKQQDLTSLPVLPPSPRGMMSQGATFFPCNDGPPTDKNSLPLLSSSMKSPPTILHWYLPLQSTLLFLYCCLALQSLVILSPCTISSCPLPLIPEIIKKLLNITWQNQLDTKIISNQVCTQFEL